MKTLATLALAAFVLVAGTAQAQDSGDAGIFADPAGTATTLAAGPGVPFLVYAVAFDLEGDLFAYEVGFDGIPAGAFVLSSTLFGPAPLNVGDPVTFNFIVGTGGCVPGQGALPLVTLNVLATTPIAPDTAILLRGTQPSSFGGVPGYAQCDETSISPFGVATSGGGNYPDGALILNATTDGPVSDDADSFGSLKARF